jgi:hypothetical protein
MPFNPFNILSIRPYIEFFLEEINQFMIPFITFNRIALTYVPKLILIQNVNLDSIAS